MLTAADVCNSEINLATEEDFDGCVATFKGALSSFLEIFSDQEDHSITVEREGEEETLPDNQAYLQICNELKSLHETFTCGGNKESLKSPGWRRLRSSREPA